MMAKLARILARSAALALLAVVVGVPGRTGAAEGANATPAGDLLTLARKTLAYVQASAPRPTLSAELAAMAQQLARPAGRTPEALARLRDLRRRIILSHPLLDFDSLLINTRPPPRSLYAHLCDQYYGRHSKAGPGLVVLSSWKTAPKAKVLLAGKLPVGSVLHPDLSFDGKRVIFAFCDHTAPQPAGVKIPTHPTVARGGYTYEKTGHRRFFIYEAGLDGKTVRQLTGTASDPMRRAGDRQTVLIEDFDPCYLPGGGFAFVSTRCQSFGRCHWGRYTPAYLLYRANADGTGIRRISFGEANEWDPSVLPDGRLIYARWDYINRHNTWFQSLWVTRPDGSGTAHYYGNYTRNPCMTSEAAAVPGSHKVVCTATAHHFISAGSTILIDPRKGVDGPDPIQRITPEVKFPETEGWGLAGCYTTPAALSEEMYLVAYSPQTVNWERTKGQYGGTWPSDNAFGIYLIDTFGGRELIYRDQTVSCFAPIPIRPRPTPAVLPSAIEGAGDGKTGVFFVQDVHCSARHLAAGTIKGLRINRMFHQPTAHKPIISRSGDEILKGVVGTVPVGPGGSVAFRAPAGVPLQIQALDADGLAVMTMRSSVYLIPGEEIGCVGCHEPRSASPLLKAASQKLRIRTLTDSAGPKYAGGFSFARTVQPVLDRYCIDCHGLKDDPGGKLVLIGKRTRFNAAHDALIARKGLVAVAVANQETYYSKPKDYYAHAGKLAAMLIGGHKDKKGTPRLTLDRESLMRIVNWLDLNAQYYGDYSFNRTEHRPFDPAGVEALRAHIAKTFGPALAAQPIDALVNVAMPAESRIVKAPLSRDAGGWGQIDTGQWPDTNHPGYRRMLTLVRGAIAPMPYHDQAGTCARPHCACRSCWVRTLRTTAAPTSLGKTPISPPVNAPGGSPANAHGHR